MFRSPRWIWSLAWTFPEIKFMCFNFQAWDLRRIDFVETELRFSRHHQTTYLPISVHAAAGVFVVCTINYIPGTNRPAECWNVECWRVDPLIHRMEIGIGTGISRSTLRWLQDRSRDCDFGEFTLPWSAFCITIRTTPDSAPNSFDQLCSLPFMPNAHPCRLPRYQEWLGEANDIFSTAQTCPTVYLRTRILEPGSLPIIICRVHSNSCQCCRWSAM